MFTGLVLDCGHVVGDPRESGQGGVRLLIEHGAELSARLSHGASLAVSGVCLTLVEHRPGRSEVEMSPETLSRTTLGRLRDGDRVNLEPALRMGDPLGGHWVQGHVDGVLELIERQDLTDHRRLVFRVPAADARCFVEKGSVTLDGVSLTVAALLDDQFDVALIPHTLDVTTLGSLEPGQHVNYEVDILAKYVQRALATTGHT